MVRWSQVQHNSIKLWIMTSDIAPPHVQGFQVATLNRFWHSRLEERISILNKLEKQSCCSVAKLHLLPHPPLVENHLIWETHFLSVVSQMMDHCIIIYMAFYTDTNYRIDDIWTAWIKTAVWITWQPNNCCLNHVIRVWIAWLIHNTELNAQWEHRRRAVRPAAAPCRHGKHWEFGQFDEIHQLKLHWH